jgi:hypothetical protein
MQQQAGVASLLSTLRLRLRLSARYALRASLVSISATLRPASAFGFAGLRFQEVVSERRPDADDVPEPVVVEHACMARPRADFLRSRPEGGVLSMYSGVNLAGDPSWEPRYGFEFFE